MISSWCAGDSVPRLSDVQSSTMLACTHTRQSGCTLKAGCAPNAPRCWLPPESCRLTYRLGACRSLASMSLQMDRSSMRQLASPFNRSSAKSVACSGCKATTLPRHAAEATDRDSFLVPPSDHLALLSLSAPESLLLGSWYSSGYGLALCIGVNSSRVASPLPEGRDGNFSSMTGDRSATVVMPRPCESG